MYEPFRLKRAQIRYFACAWVQTVDPVNYRHVKIFYFVIEFNQKCYSVTVLLGTFHSCENRCPIYFDVLSGSPKARTKVHGGEEKNRFLEAANITTVCMVHSTYNTTPREPSPVSKKPKGAQARKESAAWRKGSISWSQRRTLLRTHDKYTRTYIIVWYGVINLVLFPFGLRRMIT